MAHVEKRGPRRWRARYRGPDGAERSGLRAPKQRRALADGQEASKLTGVWVDPALGRMTFAEWVDRWESTTVDLRPTTRALNLGIVRNYLPRFGVWPLSGSGRPRYARWSPRSPSGRPLLERRPAARDRPRNDPRRRCRGRTHRSQPRPRREAARRSDRPMRSSNPTSWRRSRRPIRRSISPSSSRPATSVCGGVSSPVSRSTMSTCSVERSASTASSWRSAAGALRPAEDEGRDPHRHDARGLGEILAEHFATPAVLSSGLAFPGPKGARSDGRTSAGSGQGVRPRPSLDGSCSTSSATRPRRSRSPRAPIRSRSRNGSGTPRSRSRWTATGACSHALRRRSPRAWMGCSACRSRDRCGTRRDRGAFAQVSRVRVPAFQAGYAGSIPVTRSTGQPPSKR